MENYSHIEKKIKKNQISEGTKIDFPTEVGAIGDGNQPNQFQQQGNPNQGQNFNQYPQQQQGFGQRPAYVPGIIILKLDGFNIYQPQTTQIKDPFQILLETDTCVIKQSVNIIQMLTGCEQKNRYDVFVTMNGITIRLFRCKEQSGWCMRNCCPASSRSFVMSLKFVAGIQGDIDEDFTAPIAIFNRPFTCTCCCLAR